MLTDTALSDFADGAQNPKVLKDTIYKRREDKGEVNNFCNSVL